MIVYSFFEKWYMFDILTPYIFKHKELYLPGIGTFALIPKNAVSDFAERAIQSPGWNVLFRQEAEAGNVNTNSFYQYVAQQLQSSPEESKKKFDDFCADTTLRLQDGNDISWDGLGTMSSDNGHITFKPLPSLLSPFSSVTANKVIRQNASHAVLVGEKETTTLDMLEQLNAKEKSASVTKKIIISILIIGAVAAAIYYFSR